MVVPPQSCKATAPTIHSAASTPGELAMWRGLFDQAMASKLANPRSLADVVGQAFPEGRIFRDDAEGQSGMGRSQQLSSRRHEAYEEPQPQGLVDKEWAAFDRCNAFMD
jgi:hypothetical protein